MTTDHMPVFLSLEPAGSRWGENALLSTNDKGVIIHFNETIRADTIQIAARKLDSQGIKFVKLEGNGWDLECSWCFWQGFRNPKGKQDIVWPTLNKKEQRELSHRLQAIDWVRDITNSPAEALSPELLSQKAADLLVNIAGDQVSYSITKGAELEKQGYMGIYTVGKGASREPALLELDYNPTGKADAKIAVCLVGKGITFDSGGYSLKSSAFMDSMKSDMGGSALVTGALALAISRGLKQRVKLYLCCADNLVSGNAFKLGDVIHYRNGKSVEVMNTDAEGRLVLADGLIEAENQSPALIIDCATLTGAAKTALGNDYHAAFSFDDHLVNELMVSAEQENEAFWRLPLAEFHRNQLPSNFADLSNIAGGAYSAGASTAAAFLSHFVKDYHHNWLHIDCSAAYRKSAVDQWAVGATGLGVRTLANLLLKHKAANSK